MTTNRTSQRSWEDLRTDETRRVEDLLRQHFAAADAYRFNSASIRVRIVDSRFEGLTDEQRDDLVDPVLSQLDERTQADIVNLTLLYPGEEAQSFRAHLQNLNFEEPLESML